MAVKFFVEVVAAVALPLITSISWTDGHAVVPVPSPMLSCFLSLGLGYLRPMENLGINGH